MEKNERTNDAFNAAMNPVAGSGTSETASAKSEANALFSVCSDPTNPANDPVIVLR